MNKIVIVIMISLVATTQVISQTSDSLFWKRTDSLSIKIYSLIDKIKNQSIYEKFNDRHKEEWIIRDHSKVIQCHWAEFMEDRSYRLEFQSMKMDVKFYFQNGEELRNCSMIENKIEKPIDLEMLERLVSYFLTQ